MKSNMSALTKRLQKVITPLSRTEERQAVKSVTAYMTQQYPPRSEPRFRVFPPALRIEKGPRREAVPKRLIGLLVVDYGNRRNLDFLLDAGGKVVRVEPYQGVQPDFHVDEVREARQIAERDERVGRLAKQRGAFVSDFAPESAPEEGARVVGLRYVLAKKDHVFELLGKVSVDLITRQIVQFEPASEAGIEEQ